MQKLYQPMDKLTFDPQWHCYKLNDIPMSGVSTILKRAGLVDFDGIPLEVLERARDFGIAVHKACELLDACSLDFSTVAEALIPYLEAWKKFKDDFLPKIKEIELPVYSKKWWYAGTLDRIVTIKDKVFLLDIKSSASVYPAMKIQIAGYQVAFEEMTLQKISGRWVVQLLKTGQYKIHQHKDPADIQVFLSAVQISKFKRREKDYYERNNNDDKRAG